MEGSTLIGYLKNINDLWFIGFSGFFATISWFFMWNLNENRTI